jgi:hypothetical protein
MTARMDLFDVPTLMIAAQRLLRAGRYAEAVSLFRRLVERQPDNAKLHVELAHALLTLGQYTEGWREFRWRARRALPIPEWDGRALHSERVLLDAEQGAGDCIQCVRYAPLVAARGGRPVIAAWRGLGPLLATADGVADVVAAGADGGAAYRAALFDLPLLFGTTLETIPNAVPYLTPPDAAAAERWRARLVGPGLKVGLCWQGNPEHPRDRERSLPFVLLKPLFSVPGVRFFGLQVGEATGQARGLGAAPFENLAAALDDDRNRFVEAAAAVANLDLVITVDTALAHLAGALARPVWILLSFVPDWRWLLEREDSPWYPTARLFRQPALGAWRPVMVRVREALAALAATA